MINQEWRGKDTSGRGLIYKLQWNLPVGTEEDHENITQDKLSPGQNL
jgi:hypothetical protein